MVEFNGDFSAPQRFALSLAARRTVWRYVALGAAAGASLRLQGRDAARQPIAFSGPTAARYGGREALCFESAQPLAFLERPGEAFAMSLTVAAGETAFALSFADPARPAAGGAATEIFINL